MGRPLDISVVIAVGNVEDHIGHDVRRIAQALSRRHLVFEILAVGDDTRDTSLPLLQVLREEVPELQVWGGSGTGRAFRRGSTHARGEWILLWEASSARAFPAAVLGFALAELSRKDVFIIRGRLIAARRQAALSVLLPLVGKGEAYEQAFERRTLAAGLRLGVRGPARRRPSSMLMRAVRGLLIE
jgi:hypothetical protein